MTVTSKIKRNGHHDLLKNGILVGEAWRWPVRFNGKRPVGFGLRVDGFYWRNGEANTRSGSSGIGVKTLREARELADKVLA